MMICLKIEEKIIPPAVVREQLSEKVTEIEKEQGYKVRKKQKDNLRDEVFFTLLPRAFSQSSLIYAYFDTQEKLLIIDSSSRNKAEMFCEFLRKTLGSLALENPDLQTPSTLMTNWLKTQTYPHTFALRDACVLEGNDESVVRCQRQDLFSPNIHGFLDEGAHVVQMAMSWAEQISFVLKNDFSISGIRFLETIKELANDAFTETPEERFDADFAIMTETLRRFLHDLMALLGQSDDAVAKKEEKELEMAE